MLNSDEIQTIIANIESGAYDVADVLEAIASAAKGEDVRAALYASVYATKEAQINGQPKIVTEAANMKNPDIKYLYLGSEVGYKYGFVYAFVDGVLTATALYGEGKAGYSPTATVTQTETGATITITDENGTTTAAITNGTATDAQVEEFVADWLDDHPDATTTVEDGSVTMTKLASDVIAALERNDGVTEDIKDALLDCFAHVAWIDDDGQEYYDALEDALYPPIHAIGITLNTSTIKLTELNATQQLTATLIPADATDAIVFESSDDTVATVSETGLVTAVAYGSATITVSAGSATATCAVSIAQVTVDSISAVYTQSGTVYDTDTLDSLKSDLVITATYSDESTAVIPSADYTLSGTLATGTSTITVTYSGESTTFAVTVTHNAPLYELPDFTATVTSSNIVTVSGTDHIKHKVTAARECFIKYNGTATGTNSPIVNHFGLSLGDVVVFKVKNISYTGASGTNYLRVQLKKDDAVSAIDTGQMTITAGDGTLADKEVTKTMTENISNVTLWSRVNRTAEVDYDVECYVNGVRYL